LQREGSTGEGDSPSDIQEFCRQPFGVKLQFSSHEMANGTDFKPDEFMPHLSIQFIEDL
jgi:glutathione peroxidase-family protein